MNRDNRKIYYNNRERDFRNWERERFRDNRYEKERDVRKRSRSPDRRLSDPKHRSRSPRRSDKELLDDNILNEISKLPEPSELWDSRHPESRFGSAPPPPSFEGSYGSSQVPYSGLYNDFGPSGGQESAWNQLSLPPPPTAVTNAEDQMKKEAAIETEMRHQKAALSKQREDYIKKAAILKKELETLKDQRNELRGDTKRSPSPDTKRFLKENTKLQLEIQNKLKTINNVVDMLNGIIGEDAMELPHGSDDSPDRSSKRKSRSPTKTNYVYYDPEMHWCRVCNEFPATAKDYLNHLHSPAHQKMAAAHMEAPWHSITNANEGYPNYPSAPTKRTPIRGLQFFVPSTAWYCKLCDQFIGDLHCASAHLKSIVHSKNYINFVEQNPHWETDWMSDRQKAFEKSRSNKSKIEEKAPQYTAHTITFHKEGFHTKGNKNSPQRQMEKKKKKDKKKKSKRKRNSSSSSRSSSSSGSESEHEKKKRKSAKLKFDPNDKELAEWMSKIPMDRLNESDRKLLDNLKSRIRSEKLEVEKHRSVEHQRERSENEIPRKREIIRRSSSHGREQVHREERREDMRQERREDIMREERREEVRREERREEIRRKERREERREERRDRSQPRESKQKPEIKKMPFIGKMPVYKNVAKVTKSEEQKKDDEKKKEEDEAVKKRREEMDAEIQKKVAEFKQKIAKAQLERSLAELGPPTLALPTSLAQPPPLLTQPPPPIMQLPQPAPAPNPLQPALQKDFQEALDIIFPSDVKPDISQSELFSSMPPGFPFGMTMQPYQPLSMPQMQQHMMVGFDMNNQMYQNRPLYEAQLPLGTSQSPQSRQPELQNNKQNTASQIQSSKPQEEKQENGSVGRKQEELDDLAMLGIDASDVGAGI